MPTVEELRALDINYEVGMVIEVRTWNEMMDVWGGPSNSTIEVPYGFYSNGMQQICGQRFVISSIERNERHLMQNPDFMVDKIRIRKLDEDYTLNWALSQFVIKPVTEKLDEAELSEVTTVDIDRHIAIVKELENYNTQFKTNHFNEVISKIDRLIQVINIEPSLATVALNVWKSELEDSLESSQEFKNAYDKARME